MEISSGDVDAEAAAKKRRRSKWDTPAATPTPSAVDSSIFSNSVPSFNAPLLATMKPPVPMGLPAPAQTLVPRMPPLPLQMPMIPMMPIINMALVSAASKLDCRIYVGWVENSSCQILPRESFL